MDDYRFSGAENDNKFSTIYATHPALPGTCLVYAFKDGGCSRESVIAWGLLADGTPVPITMDGVWGGVDQANQFVRFPDGRCSAFNANWPDEASAIAELGQREPQS